MQIRLNEHLSFLRLNEANAIRQSNDTKYDTEHHQPPAVIDFITIHYLRMMVWVAVCVWWMGFLILGSSHIQILA